METPGEGGGVQGAPQPHTIIESGVYSIVVVLAKKFFTNRLDIRLLFAYAVWMFQAPNEPVWDYVIRCKQCGRNIPAPVETMPDQYFVARCLLCGAAKLPPRGAVPGTVVI